MTHKISKIRVLSDDAATPTKLDRGTKRETADLFEALITELNLNDDVHLDIDKNAKLTVTSKTTARPLRYNDSAKIQSLCAQIVGIRTRTLLATRVAPRPLTSDRFTNRTGMNGSVHASAVDSDAEDGKRRTGYRSNEGSRHRSRSGSRERQLKEGLDKQQEELERAKAQLRDAEAAARAQKEKAEGLQTQYDQLGSRARQDGQQAAQELSDTRRELETAKQAALEAVGRATDIERQLTDATAKARSLQSQLDLLGTQNGQRGAELATLQQRLQAASEQHTTDEAALRDARSALEEAQRRAQAEKADLAARLAAASAAKDALEQAQPELTERLRGAQAQAQTLQTQLAEATATRDALQKQLSTEKELAMSSGADRDATLRQLAEKLRIAESRCAELEPQLKAAQGEISRFKGLAEENAAKLAASQQETRSLQDQLSQLKQLHQQAGDDARRHFAELEASIQQKEAQKAALQTELDALKQSAGKDQQAQAARLSDLQTQKAAAEQRATQLERDLQQARKDSENVQQLREKLAVKEREHQTSQAAIASQEQQMRAAKEETRRAQEKFDQQLSLEKEQATARVNAAKAEQSRTQQLLDQEKEARAAAERLAHTERTANELAQKQLKALQAQLAELQAAHAQCTARVFKTVVAPTYEPPLEVKKTPPPNQPPLPVQLEPPEKLKMIRAGNLAIFLEDADEAFVQLALKELHAGLQNDKANVHEIYNLAIFIAGHDEKNALGLVEPLKKWLLNRAAAPEFSLPEEQSKLNSLFGALARWNSKLPAMIASAFVSLKESQELRQQLGGLSDKQLLDLARDCIAHPENRAQRLFATDLTRELHKLDATAQTLQIPDGSGNYTLLEQLKQNVQVTEQFTRGLGGKREAWMSARKTREEDLVRTIKKYSFTDTWQKILEKEQLEPTTPPAPPVLLSPSAEEIEALNEPNQIGRFLVERLAKLMGLSVPPTPVDVLQCATSFIAKALNGELPPFIQTTLDQHEGQEALLFAQLVYKYTALKNKNPRFDKAAPYEEWDWLIGQEPKEAAKKLLLLTHELSRDPNFRGSALTSDQVKWARSLYSLYTVGQGTPIYAEAGAGKTATAQFMMRLLPKMGIPSRTVHYVSPFADSVEGMNCLRVDNFNEDIVIRSTSARLDDIVLVDEAHLLSFNTRILLKNDQYEREVVMPLYMTATPVIPNDDQRGFKTEQMTEYEKQLQEIQARLEQLNAKVAQQEQDAQWKLALDQMATVKKLLNEAVTSKETTPSKPNGKKQTTLQLLISHLPRGQQDYFLPNINKLAEAISTHDEALIQTQIQIIEKRLTEIIRKFDPTYNMPPPQDSKKHGGAKTPPVSVKKPPREITKFKGAFDVLVKLATTPVDKTKVAPALRSEISYLSRLEGLISAKITKWTHEGLKREATENEVFIGRLPEVRQGKIRNIRERYVRTQDSFEFNGQAVAQQFKDLTKSDKPMDTIQLIFPGVLFTGESVQQIMGELTAVINTPGVNPQKKPLRFVYQDSHSPAGTKLGGLEQRGRKWVLEANERNELVAMPLELFLLREKSNPTPGITVMLYDRSNLQGGDYGPLSQASAEHPIDQFIFYNFVSENVKDFDLRAVSENDLYQAIGRSRGKAVLPRTRVVVPKLSQEEFLASVTKRQQMLEGMWAAKYAAHKVARKLLKVLLIKKDPKGWGPNLKRKPLEQLQRNLDHSALKEVNLPHLIQRWLLGEQSEQTGVVKKLLEEAHVKPVREKTLEGDEYLWHADKKLRELNRYIEWARKKAAVLATKP